LFIGGLPNEQPELARLASPITHVDASDPPLLLLHGEQDVQMPINQSLELYSSYRQVGGKVQFFSVATAGHGGPLFFDAERLQLVTTFLASITP
jgi:dipeptidyl aminopeptidase/acylaminoacyl peptidase